MTDRTTVCRIGRAMDEYLSCVRWMYTAITSDDYGKQERAVTMALRAAKVAEALLTKEDK